jgi:CheY-like chemotaxis protein
MPVVLICSASPLENELARTLLWRAGIQRHVATRLEDALRLATAAKPDLVVLDRRFPRIVDFIAAVRRHETARRCSIVVLARGDFDPSEVEILEAGANAILRFPPGPEWERRLDRLLRVPTRKESRFSVQLDVDAVLGGESIVGQTVNLSTHGTLLQSPAALEMGETVTFALRLPGTFINGRGTVVRQAGAGRYGLLFDSLERDGREQIERYVLTVA